MPYGNRLESTLPTRAGGIPDAGCTAAAGGRDAAAGALREEVMSETVVGLAPMAAPFSLDDLADLIRRIVREEVSSVLEERGFYAEPTIIEPGSPVYEDLVELRQLYEAGQLEILSYEEVFGESRRVSA